MSCLRQPTFLGGVVVVEVVTSSYRLASPLAQLAGGNPQGSFG